MRGNADQNTLEYGHFLCSASFHLSKSVYSKAFTKCKFESASLVRHTLKCSFKCMCIYLYVQYMYLCVFLFMYGCIRMYEYL